MLSHLDRSQRKCWCKSCKVNLPPPWVTCHLIVFYFTSCDVPNLSVWQATWFMWRHGNISNFLSTRLENSTISLLSPAKCLMLQFLRRFITKFRNWNSFKTRCPQIQGSSCLLLLCGSETSPWSLTWASSSLSISQSKIALAHYSTSPSSLSPTSALLPTLLQKDVGARGLISECCPLLFFLLFIPKSGFPSLANWFLSTKMSSCDGSR